MKERPILFSGPIVRAILDGRKTQTRRIVKMNLSGRAELYGMQWHIDDPNVFNACPYGIPGDRLWVREKTVANHDLCDSVILSEYDADNKPVLYPGPEFDENGEQDYGGSVAHWWYSRETCPSIHMPRWASRIDLEITGVRVERLQDIGEWDAVAEGVDFNRNPSAVSLPGANTARESFRSLWESINGPGSWEANQWVWVIEFKRVA